MRPFIALIALVVSGSVLAADRHGGYAVRGYGTQTCGAYVANRSRNNDDAYANWLGGYLSGFNRFNKDTWDISGTLDTDAEMLWLENYCKAHPLDKFSEASEKLIVNLFPIRKTKP